MPGCFKAHGTRCFSSCCMRYMCWNILPPALPEKELSGRCGFDLCHRSYENRMYRMLRDTFSTAMALNNQIKEDSEVIACQNYRQVDVFTWKVFVFVFIQTQNNNLRHEAQLLMSDSHYFHSPHTHVLNHCFFSHMTNLQRISGSSVQPISIPQQVLLAVLEGPVSHLHIHTGYGILSAQQLLCCDKATHGGSEGLSRYGWDSERWGTVWRLGPIALLHLCSVLVYVLQKY